MRYGGTNKTVALSDMLQQDFDPAEMGSGYRRGMVLKVYKAKLLELIGCEGKDLSEEKKRKRRSLLNGLKGASLKPADHEAADYDNPTLVIYFRSGSMWSTEMHHRRYQLKMLINKRLKCDFINKVIIK